MCDFVSVRFTELCSGDVAQAAHWFDYKKIDRDGHDPA